MNGSRKFTAYGIILVFMLAIYVPLIGTFVQEDKTLSYTEKRKLSQAPGIPVNFEMLEEYPQEFEKYYNDQFGLREVLLNAFSAVKIFIGDTEISSAASNIPTENTIKGKEGWYFMNRVWDGDPISDYRNISLYSEKDLLQAVFLFAARKHWLQKHGIKYLLFFAPNKHTVYSEYMPDYIVKQGNISSMDQLYDALERNTSVEFVDLRNTLLEGKQEAQKYWRDNKEEAALYYKTDSHWNAAGADLVQYSIAGRIEKMFPGLINPRRWPVEDYIMTRFTGDLSLIMGRDDHAAYGPTVPGGKCSKASLEEYRQERQITTCETGKLNVLIFHDSFFTLPLKVFFADYFAQTTFLWETMSKKAVLQQLRQKKIDLVIEERAERFLPYIPSIGSELYNDFWAQHAPHWKKVIFNLGAGSATGDTGQYTGHNARLQYKPAEKALEIHATTGDPYISIRNIPFVKNKLYMLHVEIESSKKTQLQVFYSSSKPADKFPDPQRAKTYPVKKGNNVLYIPLFSGILGDRLRLDPGDKSGLYRLKKFEIREVDPASLKLVSQG